MTAFDKAFGIVVGSEGGFGADPRDPGNWTGGACGIGLCRGTKYGISAASYPTTDIAGLSVEAAAALYRRDYWDAVHGNELPPGLALLLFDAAVNNGVGQAVRWLQAAVGVTADGVIGPRTIEAVAAQAGQSVRLLAEFQSQRLVFMAGLPTWKTFGRGWARRLCRLPYDAVTMGAG